MRHKLISCLLSALVLIANSNLTVAREPLVEVVSEAADPITEGLKIIPIITKTPIITEPPTEAEPALICLGEFTLTAYCSCNKCCGKWAANRPVDEAGNEIVLGAAGERLTTGYSIAVDPDVIPLGTVVIINNHEYKAQDTGGAIKGNKIDVYFSSHEEALEFGVQTAEVYIEEVN